MRILCLDDEPLALRMLEQAVKTAGYESVDKAAADGVAFVLMGHGTSHNAKVTYSQMQTQMEKLGYANVFIGTVEGEPEETACEEVIKKVAEAGYKKVVLRPLMVVAGDHATAGVVDRLLADAPIKPRKAERVGAGGRFGYHRAEAVPRLFSYIHHGFYFC